MKIIIGVCVKNEESLIIPMLKSLVTSCQILPSDIKPYLIICANGCQDQTIPLIKSWQASNLYFPSELYVLEKGNLVEAQRLIINKSKENEVENTIFLDADIIVDKNFMIEMINNSYDKDTIVFYASSIPRENSKKNLIAIILNLYDLYGENVFSVHKYLHGRAFLIKTNYWKIPKTIPAFIADDIYLSFFLLDKYGENSIKNIKTAKVYFYQISNFRDFYHSFRRIQIEIEKCFVFNPDFQNLPKEQINRKFLWKNLLNESFTNILLWLMLLLLRKTSQILYKLESLFSPQKEQWIATSTTKNFIKEEKPILILDISIILLNHKRCYNLRNQIGVNYD